MQYKLNGNDLLERFGVRVKNGAGTLLQFPKRKESTSSNWPEQDGIDIDLGDPHFESREFRLTCTLIGNSREDFKTKYYGLFTELKKQYSQELYSTDLDETFHLYFKEMESLRKLSRRIDSKLVGVEFELVFGEVNPNDNIPVVYLVDEQNNFLIA